MTPVWLWDFSLDCLARRKRLILRQKHEHEEAVQQAKERHQRRVEANEKERAIIDEEYRDVLVDDEAAVEQHLASVDAHNLKIDHLKAKWGRSSPDAVIEHACLVLDASEYPSWISTSYQLRV